MTQQTILLSTWLPVDNKTLIDEAQVLLDLIKSDPGNIEAWRAGITNKWFRLNTLYSIKNKSGKEVQFIPNFAQKAFFASSHNNDLVLKARQLGFTTFAMLSALDDCLFIPNFSAGCIAHSFEDAKDIYRNKIRFAYSKMNSGFINYLTNGRFNLPVPTNDKDTGYVFSNGSSIRVGTGYRGGTLQSLHISEFGKICKKYPEKAKEIVTGALQAVGAGNRITIESTAEGREGYFYEYAETARALLERGKTPNSMQYLFHFYSWWQDPSYSMAEEINIPDRMAAYFVKLESKHGIKLSEGQKKWYVSKEATLGGDMTREYPSMPEEAFSQAIEGAYYALQFTAIYKDGRICDLPDNSHLPVHTCWDIGIGDSTAIWFYRMVGDAPHILDYYENSGESLGHYIKVIEDRGLKNKWSFGVHTAPHDINNREFASKGKTRKDLAAEGVEYGGVKYSIKFSVAPKLGIMDGIEQARLLLARCVFDEKNTVEGVKVLEHYRKAWDDRLGCWKDNPLHDWSSHGADAFRYLAVVENKRKTSRVFN